MKMKRVFKFLIAMLCITVLGGCGAKKLSDNYSEDKLKVASEKVIDNLNKEKFDDVIGIMDKSIKSQITVDKLKEVMESFKKLGKFDSISKMIFQEKKGIATVVSIAKYENGNIQFTLSYNKNMQLCGLYLK
ncbi:hypothetical protein ADU90_07195 [Clostridium botulinum]|uniref:DUF3887 domain-containing protein n=2 Tax=Clostridium botulinum TaxID=1491 RepID=A0A0A0HV76_CLOBO|nr:hypothetical protein Z956_13330 [Clostridium botulinum D str. CCUG 7971]KGM93084.1 hypothetical protein Z955_15980 [Clostridium botulinum C/D str. DC5]KOC49951.1 hypothetical protein ADU88_04435 [Clostridium botulinum]MCD3235200.1 DUF3887 domain-containing protein [Clostridium botulinum D/C]KGM92931.1 hypothetical protein Z956_13070 [Clostridium botulinum D str. CCUG 7971]